MSNICKKAYVLNLSDKTCNFLSLYRTPSQSQDDFETFTENLELNLENLVQRNPFLVVTVRDFNSKSSKWFCRDKTNFDGWRSNWKFNIPVWIAPGDQRTNTHIRYFFFFLYWPNLYVTAKFDNWVRSSFVSTFKLSSSDNFCKI